MPQSPEVWVGAGTQARQLTSMTWWGDLTLTHRWPLGSWEAKWRMPLAPYQRWPQMAVGARADVRVGDWPIWTGQLADIGWDSGEMVAVGACRQGDGALAFNGAGETTTIPDVAIDQAISRGVVDWSRPWSFSSAPFGSQEQTDRVNAVGKLLDAWAESQSAGWWVDPWRRVRANAAPTAPTALIIPDVGTLGVAAEQMAGTVFARYLDATTGTPRTARYPAAGGAQPEIGMSLLDKHGPITATAATAIAQGVWSKLQAQAGWTNPVTVRTGELLSMGGNPVPLWFFTAGQMVRLLGVRDVQGLAASTDVVIGESTWDVGADTLQLSPVGAAARDIGSIIEDAGGVAA